MNAASPPREGLANRVNLVLLIAAVAAAAATAIVVFREFMRWKHGRIAAEVLTRVARGEPGPAAAALASLRTEWIGADQALRCQLSVWSVTEPARALEALDATFDRQPRALKLVAAEMAIRANKPERATTMLASLDNAGEVESQVRFLRAWLAVTGQRPDVAVAELKMLLARDPVHRGASFLRARLMLESPQYAEAVRARADLRILSSGRDTLSLEALITRALHRHGTVDATERSEVVQAIIDHPLMRHAYFMRDAGTLAALLQAADGVPPAIVVKVAERLHEIAPDEPRALGSLTYFQQELRKSAEAATTLARLREVDPRSEATLHLECRQAILEQQPAAAIALLEKNRDAIATSPRLAHNVATLMDATRDAPSDIQRRAVDLGLALTPDNPQAWFAIRMRALELFPERRAEIVGQVGRQAAGDHAVLACEWLVRAGEFARALELAGPLSGRPPHAERIQLVIFESHLGLGQFEQAEALLGQTHASPVTGALLQTRLAIARGDTAAATTAWSAAFGRARRDGDAGAILQLAAGARRLGLDSEASAAFDEVADRVIAREVECDLQTLGAWLTAKLKVGASRGALDAAREIVSRSPARTPLHLEGRFWESYLELLLNEDMLGAKESARELQDEVRHEARFRALYALAQLKTGQRSLALTTLERELATDPQVSATLPLQVRVVAAAVCEANGQPERAGVWVQTLENQALLPEEKALVFAESSRPLASAP